MKDWKRPAPLVPGDKVAIVTPATEVKSEYIDGAVESLRRHGYEAVVYPHAKGPGCGSFAATHAERLADLKGALEDPEIKAVLCSRGGYGTAWLLDGIDWLRFRENPKWIIGFSDISALHAAAAACSVNSLHSSMAKMLATQGEDEMPVKEFYRLLEGGRMDYSAAPHPLNIEGECTGRLLGGNLAVLNGLASTPYDIFALGAEDGAVLFIEDIAEPIYKVERVLLRLCMAGQLQKMRGIIVGQFTEYHGDRNFATMEQMISSLLQARGIIGVPVAMGFPCGHIDENMPLVEGALISLDVESTGVTLREI